MNFEKNYPWISKWVNNQGWIQMGEDEIGKSFVMAYDEGGIIFEGKKYYVTIDEALADLEKGIHSWIKENGLEDEF